ncbi:hemicentin-1-like isoform X2 [Pimephales promelas]|uniref:hemicentin-1-like isoform X2 n=1 Tax=Pimephales promelas TaxID=90988 RepID=UPI0019557DB9|nr:hemicentin-1-like isoform X2 [Pimephales promelas]
MLQHFFGLFYLLAVSQLLTFTGSYADECPVQLNPQRVIVEFGGSVSADCSTSVPHTGLGWEASEGGVPMSRDSLITWRVSNLTEWDIEPICFINYNKGQCTVPLPVTIYKTPDSVSISTVNHTGPMMEGNQYELQCDVLNVAPVQNLIINWYKGQTLVDQTNFTDTIKTPVSKTSKLLIRPDRADDGAQYWCEAKLELGEEGPQPPPTAPSKHLNVEVFYKPKHSSSTETISINDELNCTVKANPAPTYSWQSEHLKETITSSVLQSSTISSGNYKCIASNSQGNDTKVFILKSTGSYADECPVQLNPQRVIVEFGGFVSADCSTSVPHRGMGWEASEGAVPMRRDSLITWRVSNLTEWDIEPICYINYKGQCTVPLPVTIYKTPDSVSISTVNHTGPMMEGNQYELQCDVLNVAPVQNLIINWYKGQTLVDQTIFTDTIKTPVSKTSKLLIRPDGADDGDQYWCEAKLELGEEGPQPPPEVTSDPLNIIVYYGPIINENKLPSIVPVFRGYPVEIVCEAEGNPTPIISWNLSTTDIVYSETLTITESTPEDLHCIASNSAGTTIRRVKVSIQDGDCPVQLNPQRVIVEFGGSVSADCSTSVPHTGLGWEASEGAVPMGRDSLITWRVSNLTEWDIEPICFINYKKQCEVPLPVTIYKTPDSVSISTVNHTGPMMEGNQYELQCDVLNVAPVQNLIISWYKEQTLLDQTNFTDTIFNDTIKTPVSKTSTLLIRPDRADDGAQYKCEAKLELGEEGLQPPPEVTSDPLNITVYYGPIINGTKLPSKVLVFRRYPVEIVCEAEGNPTPIISWNLGTTDIVYSENLTITESTPEDLQCIAINSVGSTIRSVKVSIQDGDCPVQLNPQRVIVEFGGSVSADCSTSVPHKGMGWEASEGAVPMSKDSLITWRVSDLTDWDIEPICYINYKGQCTVPLPVTIYKTPDSVSISTVNHNGPMMEGNQYELQCDVLNVAPVQNLIIIWYKGQTQVDQTNFTDTIKTPVSKTSKLLIRPDRADDGAQYWCEAKLELGEEGPQPPPTAPSKHLNITVYYAPVLHASQDKFDVDEGSHITLECNSTGNPEPEMTWSFQNKNVSTGRRHILFNIDRASAGVYTCNATNLLGHQDKTFEVKIRGNSPNYNLIVLAVIVVLIIIIAVIYLWRKKKSRGSYHLQPVKSYEMQLLNNGGKC